MRRTKVLIVDDYKENITALTRLIEDQNIDLYSATTPDEALKILHENDEFGLALLDVQMPEMSGFELARLIRGVKKHSSLPIIFVTAQQKNNNFVFEGYESGAVDILFKPLDPHIVRTKVRAFVELSNQRIQLQEQVAELDRLKQEAESANRAKVQFLANMSHEIRTPLAAVLGFSDLISTENFEDKEREKYADMIKRNGELLLRLIDDILDLSKIETNQIEFENEKFNFLKMIENVEGTMVPLAEKKDLKLLFDVEVNGSQNYVGDVVRISQIFINVIGNAIKFTDKGNVKVNVRSESSLTSSLLERFTVRITDTGVGMTPEQIRKIFKPFSQGDSSVRRQFGGSGLGLTISKRLAKALRGDIIIVESKLGEGSTFEITFQLEKDPSSKSSGSNKSSLDNWEPPETPIEILAVDDAKDNLVLLNLYLKEDYINLKTVQSAKAALEEVENFNYDLILMDIQMPELDGRDATRILRKRGYDFPIIALTAHAVPSEKEKCIKAGCDEVLTKPINRDDLINTIKQKMARKKRIDSSSIEGETGHLETT